MNVSPRLLPSLRRFGATVGFVVLLGGCNWAGFQMPGFQIKTNGSSGQADAHVAATPTTTPLPTPTATPHDAGVRINPSQSGALNLGVCNGAAPVTVTVVDANGVPLAVSTSPGLLVTFTVGTDSSGNPLAQLFADNGCLDALTLQNGKPSLNIPTHSAQAVFYIKPMSSSPLVITATAGLFPPASQTFSITPIPAQIAFVQPPTSIGAGLCSAFNFQILDADGQPITSLPAQVTVTVAASTGSGILYSSASSPCGTSLGSGTSASLNLSGSGAGTFSVNTSQTGSLTLTLSIPIAGSSKPAQVSATVTVQDVVTQVVISGGPASGSVRMGITEVTPFIATVKDAAGNSLASHPALTITLSTTEGTATFFLPTTPTAATTQLSIGNGSSYAQFLVKATSLDHITIAAAISAGLSYSPSTSLRVPVQQVVTSVRLTPPTTPAVVTGGIPSGAFTLTLLDGNGNPFCPSTPIQINLGLDPGFNGLVCTAAGCPPSSLLSNPVLTSNGSTQISFYLLTDPDFSQSLPLTATPQQSGVSPAQIYVTANRNTLSPDTSFAPNGQVTYAVSGQNDNQLVSASQGLNGAVVGVGYESVGGARNLAIVRMFGPASAAPGQLDTSFNNSGEQFYPIGSYSYASAVVTRSIGGEEYYLVGGTALNPITGNDFFLAQFRSSGAPDTSVAQRGMLDLSWGTNGVQQFQMANDQYLQAIDVSPSTGNIYAVGTTAAGSTNGNDMLILGLTSSGSTLSGFPSSGNGITVDFGGGANDYANNVAVVTQNGKDTLFISGITNAGSQYNVAAIHLIPPSGTQTQWQVDPSFGPSGSGGKVSIPVGTGTIKLTSMIVDASGNLVLAGYRASGEILLVRLLPNGTLDSSFGSPSSPGIAILNVVAGQAQTINAIVQSPKDGNYYLAGSIMASTSSGPNEDFLIVVVGPSGAQRSLTPSFASFDFGGIADHAYAILFEGGKPFLIGGGYNVMTGGDSFAFLSLLR